MNMAKVGGLLGLMAGTLGGEDEAQAAIRPDILDVVKRAAGGAWHSGQKAGTLESTDTVAKMTGGSHKYRGGTGYFTQHGLTRRIEKDKWPEQKVADVYSAIFNSPKTAVIPNALGRDVSASEALWLDNGNGTSFYMPIVPYKKGFKGISVYDPKTSDVENYLRKQGYWEDGLNPSIFTPTLEAPAEQVGSGTGKFSAVNTPAFGTSLGDLLTKGKNNLPAVAGASGAALSHYGAEPEQAYAFPGSQAYTGRPDHPLETPWFDPVDIFTAPVGVPGVGAKAAAMGMAPVLGYGTDRLGGLLGMMAGQ